MEPNDFINMTASTLGVKSLVQSREADVKVIVIVPVHAKGNHLLLVSLKV